MLSQYLPVVASLLENDFAFPSHPLGPSLEEEIKEKMLGWLFRNLRPSKPAVILFLIRNEPKSPPYFNFLILFFTAVLED